MYKKYRNQLIRFPASVKDSCNIDFFSIVILGQFICLVNYNKAYLLLLTYMRYLYCDTIDLYFLFNIIQTIKYNCKINLNNNALFILSFSRRTRFCPIYKKFHCIPFELDCYQYKCLQSVFLLIIITTRWLFILYFNCS